MTQGLKKSASQKKGLIQNPTLSDLLDLYMAWDKPPKHERLRRTGY